MSFGKGILEKEEYDACPNHEYLLPKIIITIMSTLMVDIPNTVYPSNRTDAITMTGGTSVYACVGHKYE